MLKTLRSTGSKKNGKSDRAAAPTPAAHRELFVPMRKDELIDWLVQHGKLDSRDAGLFREICRLIETIHHHEFHQRQELLKRLYASFDPDSDTRPLQSAGQSRTDLIDEFLAMLGDTLTAANYYPLSPEQMDHALSGTTYWGLDLQINRDIFDRLLIYARGDSACSRIWCDASTWFRRREVELEVFQRLVLAVKLRPSQVSPEMIDTDDIYIKMFREIPKLDLEMLLPGTRPRMRWLDATKIGGSSMTGLYGLIKMVMATLFGKFTWAMVALGAFSYAIQSFLGYRRTKAQYIYSMTQQLYYQNLDNNAGVFCRIIDEAEDEQTKETILGYYFLWRLPHMATATDRLGNEIEKLLTDRTGECCRFDASDAIAKLQRLGLLSGPTAAGDPPVTGEANSQLGVIDPATAVSILSARLAESLQVGAKTHLDA